MIKQCPICHDSSRTILIESRLNLYRCNSCLHTFTIIPKDKQEKYDNDYFLKTHKNWMSNPNYRLFDFIYEESIKLLGNEQIRLLDVGCGRGDFLKYIAAKNPTAKLFGIDLVYNQHPGIHFIKGNFLEEKLEEKIETKFNIICSLAVIEHVDNPQLFVQKISYLLQFSGFLFITTVNSDSLFYRIARLLNKVGIHTAFDRLYSFHHLQHYTDQSLRKLMEMNGFDILLKKNHDSPIKAVDVPKSNFLIEKMYRLLVWLIFLLSAAFGVGILQTIVCRKSNSCLRL